MRNHVISFLSKHLSEDARSEARIAIVRHRRGSIMSMIHQIRGDPLFSVHFILLNLNGLELIDFV